LYPQKIENTAVKNTAFKTLNIGKIREKSVLHAIHTYNLHKNNSNVNKKINFFKKSGIALQKSFMKGTPPLLGVP